MVARHLCPPGRCLAASLVGATLLYHCEAVQALRTRQPLASNWFGSNSDAESSRDAAAGHPNLVGWEYNNDNPSATTGTGHSAESYHESPSGAWKEAWQTHWPASAATGAWKLVGGQWTEEYRHAAPRTPTVLQPEWFDSSVLQKDMYGRPRAPDADSPRRELFWQERAVNTTLTCDTANCTGITMLQAFNPAVEKVNHCKLSLYLHPTDFDDLYSGERLAWVTVNNHLVNSDCYPMISGCNASAQAPMYPCLQDLPLETILNETGMLEIAAQISESVDECPYEGHLLSAVPMVTCQVMPREPLEAAAAQPELPLAAVQDVTTFTPVVASVPLQCAERGCIARASITPTPDLAAHIRTYRVQCMMNVMLYQTDFDGEEGTPELLEYLRVNDSDVVSDFAPGANPCRSQWAGKPLPEDKRSIWVVRDQDVTALFLLDGGVNVEAKITNFVDECAHNGYLLDALMDLRCDLNPNATRLTTPAPSTTEEAGTTPITHVPPLQQLPDLPPLEALVTPAPEAAPRNLDPPTSAPVPPPAPPAPPPDDETDPEPGP